jgi:inner membrane protein
MDTLTHALLGALIGRATASRDRTDAATGLPTRHRMLVGFLAAAFPDSDIVASYLSPLSYLYHHRGITHSLILLPAWAALLAFTFAALWRGGPRWRAYFGICALGIGSHILTDWITSFGTMIWAPFSDARYALNTTFVIDLWFTGIIVLGLIACVVWRARRAVPITALAVLLAYVGFQYVLEQRAIEFGAAYARANSVAAARVSAIPRPVSPFNWTVIVRQDSTYAYSHVNLIRKRERRDAGSGFIAQLDAPYKPVGDAVWVRTGLYGSDVTARDLAAEAYEQPGFGFFRWFAAYPALLRVDADSSRRCAWFYDLRFSTPGREQTPFRYGMCREQRGEWKAYELRGNAARAVY